MATYGPDERALFEDDATKLYEEVCQRGGIASSDYRITDGGELRGAFDLLVEMGLLSYDSEQDLWSAEDPASVQSRVVSPLSQQAAKLLTESSQWNAAFGSLTQSWRRAPQASPSRAITYLRGTVIDGFLAQLLSECEEELLTAQPAGRPQPARPWPRRRCVTSRRWSGGSRCAPSTSTAPGAARSRTSTSPR